ncbi:MAG: ferredoxin family protein [Candidatus Heimdallarchaeota archaeon]|nr:ferredoxin family protein [Candidatus Heimdallarchaeota archaeon]
MSNTKIQNEKVQSNNRFDAYIVSKKEDRVFVVDRNRCKGCKICVSICPFDAIFMSNEKSHRGNFYPIENGACKACKKCLYACPDFALSIHMLEEVKTIERG